MRFLFRSTLILLPVFLFVLGVSLRGFSSYRLNLSIITDNSEEFLFESNIDDRQFKKIENNCQGEILPFLIEARKEFANKSGYRKEIYGDENYKMVKIRRYSVVIREISTDRIVFKKT